MTLNVQLNGVTKFQADRFSSIQGDNWNFVTDAPPPPPVGQLTRANVHYVSHRGTTALNVDVTQYKNLAGRQDADQPIRDYPFFASTFELVVPANKYLAMQFVPNGPQTTHMIKMPIYGSGMPMRFSMSLRPGDFNPATALKVVENCIYDDNVIFYYRNGPGTAFYIGVQNGVPVYINAQAMDPSHITNLRIASQ